MVSTLFDYYIITHWMSYLQLDIFLVTTFSTFFDLLGYICGWALFRQIHLIKAYMWAFGLWGVAGLLLILYAHVY